jgi:Ca-activated chloride channel family protein
MLVFLSLFFACNGTDIPDGPEGPVAENPPETPPPPKKIPAILLADTEPVAIPAGEVTTRSCGGDADYGSTTRPGTTRTTARPPAKPSPSASVGSTATPAPTSARPPSAGARPTATLPSTPAPVAVTAPPPPPAAPPMASSPSGGADISRGQAAGEGTRAASEPAPKAKKTADAPSRAPADDGDRSARDEEVVAAQSTPTPQQPSVDWGAVVYLSNDDSMSLASAQHLLHDVKNGDRFGVGDIRPHELLNYFSFDTAPVAEGDLFSIQASAEKTADETLSLALAVKGASPPRRPLDLTFVVDRSGSMSAEGRMEYVKRALHLAESQLVAGDRVDLVLFDDQVCTPVENYVVGRDDKAVLTHAIDQLAPRGGTNISIGMREGFRIVDQPDRDQGIHRNRRMMLLTDAQVNQGEIDGDVLAQVASEFEQHDVRVTGVGVGIGFNDAILDTITEKGKGAYVYLGSEAVVDRLFGASGFRSLTETIAHDVRFEIDLPDSLAMEKFYGEEASTDAADVETINYYAGTTQLFLQDLKVKRDALAPSDPLTFTIRYRDERTGEPGEQTFKTTLGELMGTDKHNLDKARALMGWTDVLTAKAMGANPCGQPLTAYTERAGKVQDDAEIAYVNTLVQQWCTLNLPPPTPRVASNTVAFKVKVDSDIPIAEVALACGSSNLKDTIGGADTVARFDAVPGDCQLTLQGNVAMQASVKVPSAGGDVKCTVRGGRMSCG